MALLSLQEASFDYGRKKILDRVSVSLEPAVTYALVGANGVGKTTLLAALAGELEIPARCRQVSGSVRCQLLHQESVLVVDDQDTRPLLDTVLHLAFSRERELEGQLAELATKLATTDEQQQATLIARQGQLQSEFERLDGYTVHHRLETALRGVGLLADCWQRPVSSLSGGERRRAALAMVLLSGADVLLMDEPTNHLDLESCEWLEGYIEQYQGTIVLVSHDRHFLDRTATSTLHLERGKLRTYNGNYSFFMEASELRYQQDLATYQRQQTKIRQTEDYIRRNIEGQKTKQAQSRRKQLAKIDRLERPVAPRSRYRFDLRPVRQSGGTVFETRDLGKIYAERELFRGVDLLVSRGERIGIIGPNGCGKTTLLKTLAGQETYEQGAVIRGHNVDVGLYDQHLLNVADHHTVMGEIAAVDPLATVGELRTFLGAFGFGEEMIDLPVAELSGGERGRLTLLRLIKEGHNTLLLDEPTNHLDTASRESLEQALRSFTGTLLVVSHDRRFLDRVADRLWIFAAPAEAVPGATTTGSLRQFPGNYTEFARRRREERLAAAGGINGKTDRKQQSRSTRKARKSDGKKNGGAAGDATGRTTVRRALSKNEQARRSAWITEAESDIERLESEKEAVLAEMTKQSIGADTMQQLASQCADIDEQLATRMAQWEQWHLEIEEGI